MDGLFSIRGHTLNIETSTLDAFLEHKRLELRLPGLSVAVVQDGRIAYQRGLGAAAPGRAMTPQTPCIIGSLSKSFTALAALQLVEAGKLELDAPVVQYIPWFRLADSATSDSITIKHLLTHTSGISRFAGRALLAGRGEKSIEQSVRELCTLKLKHAVGTTFEYSNTNYLVAGLVIEMVAGQPFAEYIQQHIFNRLDMQHSYTSEEAARRGGLASGYRWWFGVPFPFDAPYLPDALPAAFIAASAEDMARYALALLGGSPVLSPAGVAELHQPQVTTALGSSYALGWRVESLAGVPIVRHGGEVSNFLSEAVLLPEQRAGVVVLMNAGNGLTAQAVKEVSRLGSDIARRFLLGQPVPRRHLSFGGFYALLNVVLAGLSFYQIWSLVAVLCSGSARLRSVLRFAALCEVWLAAAAVRRIPRLADSPWSLLKLYVPDITSWLLVFFGCSLVKCFMLLGRLTHQLHTCLATDNLDK
jgi:CubicO group peptidase (beta-lactamase class C family)